MMPRDHTAVNDSSERSHKIIDLSRGGTRSSVWLAIRMTHEKKMMTEWEGSHGLYGIDE